MPRYSRHYVYVADGEKYVLSQVAIDPRRNPFRSQFIIMGRLSRHLKTVRTVVRSRTRHRRQWIEDGGCYWFVRRYTEHDPEPDWTSQGLVEAAGRELAQVHLVSQKEKPRLVHLPPRLAPYHWRVSTVLRRRQEVVADMVDRGRPHRDVIAVQERLERLNEERASVDLGPEGVTHQDFQPGNILVRGETIAEVIDWDLAREDHYLYDTVLGALHLGWCAAPRPDMLNAADWFLKAHWGQSGDTPDPEALCWMFRFVTARNLAVSHSPGKWRTLLTEVDRRLPYEGHELCS